MRIIRRYQYSQIIIQKDIPQSPSTSKKTKTLIKSLIFIHKECGKMFFHILYDSNKQI